MSPHGEETNTEKQELLDTFKAKSVGRGIWHVMHKLVAMLILGQLFNGFDVEFQVLTIHLCFMMYCEYIYCLICRHHAAEFIGSNPILPFLNTKKDISAQIYFEWLYNFHKAANHNANKNSPAMRDVINFYLGSGITTINEDELKYKDIQVGIWHFFFMLVTKCHQSGQISAVYYLLSQFMSSLPGREGSLFRDFAEKHKFTDALLKEGISNQELCMSFFDWIYALHSDMNTKLGFKVYSLDLMKDAYYNLEFCDNNCDQ